MKADCCLPSFSSYMKYNEYKFFSRKSHDEFTDFIANYEQLKFEIEEGIYKIHSRAQLSVLDLLSASNLANEDVEQILNSKYETESPEDLYQATKKCIQEIADALTGFDVVKGDIVHESNAEEDLPLDYDYEHENVKKEIRETENTSNANSAIKMNEKKPFVIKFTVKANSSTNTAEKASDDQFYCDGCKKTLDNEKNYINHKKLRGCGSLCGINFDCDECENKFDSFDDLRTHREESHLKGRKWDQEKYIICPDCGKTVSKNYYLSQHKQFHLNEGLTVQCPECGKIVGKNGFRKHMDEHKRKQSGKMFFCDECPYKANAKYKVNYHKKLVHGPKQFTCDLCGNMFTMKNSLNNHMLTAHRNPNTAPTYQCEMCEYITTCEISLATHIQLRHKESRCVCSYCNFETRSTTELESHLRDEHGVATNLTPKKDEKIHECTQCDYRAKSKQAIRIHVKVKHVGIRFKCELCEFTTTTKTGLKVHVNNIHLKVKYPCDFCPFEASSASARRRHHESKHPDQYKVYSCHLCTYRTDKKELLQRHLSGKYGKHNT